MTRRRNAARRAEATAASDSTASTAVVPYQTPRSARPQTDSEAAVSCCVCWESATDYAVMKCCSGYCCYDCMKTWIASRSSWPGESKLSVPCPRCRSVLTRDTIEKWTDITAVLIVQPGLSIGSRMREFLQHRLPDALGNVITRTQLFLTTNCCPYCNRRIYRDGGCENMTCSAPCRRGFKWVNKPLAAFNMCVFAGFTYMMQRTIFSTTYSCPEAHYLALTGLFIVQCCNTLALGSEARFLSIAQHNVPFAVAMGLMTLSTPARLIYNAQTWNPLVIASNVFWRVLSYPSHIFHAVAPVTSSPYFLYACGASTIVYALVRAASHYLRKARRDRYRRNR